MAFITVSAAIATIWRAIIEKRYKQLLLPFVFTFGLFVLLYGPIKDQIEMTINKPVSDITGQYVGFVIDKAGHESGKLLTVEYSEIEDELIFRLWGDRQYHYTGSFDGSYVEIEELGHGIVLGNSQGLIIIKSTKTNSREWMFKRKERSSIE